MEGEPGHPEGNSQGGTKRFPRVGLEVRLRA
jgi:hypothetical protein